MGARESRPVDVQLVESQHEQWKALQTSVCRGALLLSFIHVHRRTIALLAEPSQLCHMGSFILAAHRLGMRVKAMRRLSTFYVFNDDYHGRRKLVCVFFLSFVSIDGHWHISSGCIEYRREAERAGSKG
jgi:hypothetical protein